MAQLMYTPTPLPGHIALNDRPSGVCEQLAEVVLHITMWCSCQKKERLNAGRVASTDPTPKTQGQDSPEVSRGTCEDPRGWVRREGQGEKVREGRVCPSQAVTHLYVLKPVSHHPE